MAYSDNFPATRPVFMADFANGGKIDPRATFSRASTANVFDGSKHLSSENILAYSNDISTKTLDGVTATGSQTAPDGGTDAYKLTENSASSHHRFYEQIVTDGSAITFSAYFKYIGRQWVRIRLTDSSNIDRFVWFDIQNGAVGTAQTGFSGATISSSGNGYYKVSATLGTSGVGGTRYLVIAGIGADNSTSTYAGSGADAFAVWGIQVSSTGETVLNETSGSIHREYASSLVSKANNIGRFEVGTDGQSEGILIESQATNLYGNSLDMTGVAGTRTNIDSNVAVGPTGELTADALRLNDTDSNTHYREYSFTAAASTTYTFSVYLKAAGLSHAAIRSNNLFSTEYVYFNLSNGTVEGSPAMSNSMTAVGNGFYRCSVTATTTGSGAASFVIYITDSAASTIVTTGDSYRAILGQAIQIEAGSHPSSFIETSGGSTATRAAESLSVGLSDINQNPIGNAVSAVAEFDTNANDAQFRRVMVLKSGTTGLRIDPQVYSGTGYVYVANTGGGTTELTNKSGAGTGFHKVAIGLDGTTANASFDGATASTMSNADTASVQFDTLQIGSYSATQLHLDGHVKRVALYNEALSDTNLQALTS